MRAVGTRARIFGDASAEGPAAGWATLFLAGGDLERVTQRPAEVSRGCLFFYFFS